MPAEVIPMDASALGVFTVGVALPKRMGYTGYEYVYEADGVRVCDPYAMKINGRDCFGEPAAELRAEVFVPEEAGMTATYRPHATEDLVLYQLHVRGFTKTAAVKKKGTYAGLMEKIPYLKELGINAVLLLPVTEFDEREESSANGTKTVIGAPKRSYRGQKLSGEEAGDEQARLNYWGYTKSAFYFAPKSSYAANPAKACEEFAALVKALHEAEIDVYLDMMFDGSCSMTYMCEALRHWVRVYGVDGFRISEGLLPLKLVAEDVYLQKTRFMATGVPDWLREKYPGRFLEYRDNFCMEMRRCLKGDEGMVPALLHYMKNRRPGVAEIHYITEHNGFTLADLYSYDVRHNEANGEHGADGTEYNASWNCGEEGTTKKQKVLALRKKMWKNAMVTTLLSQGTPMLLAGDEFLRTKRGNNNSYCQDNEISWLDWSLLKKNREFFEFVRELIAFRKSHPMFTMERELRETDFISCGWPEFSVHGTAPWQLDDSYYNRQAAFLYYGDYIRKSDRSFEDTYYIMYNMHWEKHEFELPHVENATWEILFSTASKPVELSEKKDKRQCVELEERSIVVLRTERKEQKKKREKVL